MTQTAWCPQHERLEPIVAKLNVSLVRRMFRPEGEPPVAVVRAQLACGHVASVMMTDENIAQVGT